MSLRKKPETPTSSGATSLVTAGTIAALTQAAGATPGSVALAALGSGGLTAMIDGVVGYMRREMDIDREVWWWNVVESLSDGEDVREAVANRLDEPNAQRVIFESLRALTDRIDAVVVPPLGALTAEYLRTAAAPDWFLRGTARMLADFSEAELLAMRALLAGLANSGRVGLLQVTFDHFPAEKGPSPPAHPGVPMRCRVATLTGSLDGGFSVDGGDELSAPVDCAERLLQALTSNNLSLRGGSGLTLRMHTELVERLRRILG